MKPLIKPLLALALAAACGSAAGQWTELTRFEDGMLIYVDRASVRRDGDTAEVTHLVRWAEPQQDDDLPPYLSTAVRTRYHCTDKLERYLASTSYAGALGNGAVVTEDDQEAETWYTISAGSMEEQLWTVACGARLSAQR